MVLSIKLLAIVILIIIFAHVIQTITGFAGSMLALPFLTFIISLSDAKVLITLIGLVWSLWILYTDHKYIDWHFLWMAVVLMTIGIAIGMAIAKKVPTNALLIFMAIVIISSAIWNLIHKSSKKKDSIKRDLFFGIGAGIMQGMVLMGGPLVVVMANAYFEDRRYYRATLAVVWLFIDVILLGFFQMDSMISKQSLMLTGLSIIPLALSIAIGNYINKFLDNVKFSRLVNGLLMISGATILLQVFG
ncbi:sulfite exporter TauE/SafE family protein [Companilactobacillus muriivasis]|uniref:sulfite exporter TauE/SafE family protein n=1 Tax=Companilactobacillus muriivasis TaxID=3081444 RepID=UPI0030C7510B